MSVGMAEAEKIGDEQFFIKLHNVMYTIILPIILAFGFFGNLMNLFILTGKRIQHSLRNSEKSANTGLIALTVSDLAFCVTAFPTTFLPADNQFEGEPGFYAYYGLYSAAVISVFIMASTWLTVALAVERYRAICRPLSAGRLVSNFRTICIIIIIFIFSFLFNVPMFLKVEFETKYVNENNESHPCHFILSDWPDKTNSNENQQFIRYENIEKIEKLRQMQSQQLNSKNNSLEESFLFRNINIASNKNYSSQNCSISAFKKVTSIRSTTSTEDVLEHVFRLMWGVVGNVIPLITLAFCNTTLLFAIHKSYALRKQMNSSFSKASSTSSPHDSSQRITITLLCIVAMFLVLVAPSEIVKYYSILLSSNLDTNFHFKSIEVVTNVMQSLNFSVNFVLYCIVNPSFRKTMCEMVPFSHRLCTSSNINNRPLSITGSRNYHKTNLKTSFHASGSKKQMGDRNNNNNNNNNNNKTVNNINKNNNNNNTLIAAALLKNVKEESCSYNHVVIKLTESCL